VIHPASSSPHPRRRARLAALTLAALIACDPRPAPPPDPQRARPSLVSCCEPDPGQAGLELTGDLPFGAAVCDGDRTLWTGTSPGGAGLGVPLRKLGRSAAGVQVQLFAGGEKPTCLGGALRRAPRLTARRPEIAILGDGKPYQLPACSIGDLCTCPKCPQPPGDPRALRDSGRP
jgi:hypothetical protein